jgi:exosortase family protein XrtF
MSPMKERAIIFFLVKFIGFYLVLNTLYGFWFESFEPRADPLTHLVTRQSAWVISLFEPDIVTEPYTNSPEVSIKQREKVVINVFEGCNSINVMIVFLSFIVAFAGQWKDTLAFSAASLLLIYLLNLARVILLFFVAKYYPNSLYFFHKYLFTGGIYLVVFVLWYLWIQKFRKLQHA